MKRTFHVFLPPLGFRCECESDGRTSTLTTHSGPWTRTTMENTTVNVEVDRLMPTLSREFPTRMEKVLALRAAMKYYRTARGRIITPGPTPETEGDTIVAGFMYTTAACPGVVGHGVVSDGNMMVCESSYADVNATAMVDMVPNMEPGPLKWVIGDNPSTVTPTMPRSMMMVRASNVYTEANPLTLYNYHAVMEAMDHTGDSGFWQNLYPQLERVERNYGLYGIIYDNTVMSLGPVAGEDVQPDLEQRRPRDDHGGFLDAEFTPQSKAAGKVRLLAVGVTIRIPTRRTFEILKEIMEPLRFTSAFANKNWVVRCGGFCCATTGKVVRMMTNVWMKFNEPNMPTLHVFEDRDEPVLVVSVASGTAIRPMRSMVVNRDIVSEGPYVDTVSVYHSDTMRFCGLSFPRREEEPEQYFNVAVLTIAFSAWTAEPRPNLGLQMLRQSASPTPIKGDATMVSVCESKPMISTTWGDAITNGFTDPLVPMPEKPVTVAFVNMYMNTEDSSCVSEVWAMSGLMAWTGVINYRLPLDVGYVKPGTILRDQPWWKPALEGTVLSRETTKTGDPYVIVHVSSNGLMPGDKIGNAHGIKMTVGDVIKHEDMIEIVDERTGIPFKPSVIMSTKNLTRGIGGLLRHISASTERFESMHAFRSLERPTGTGIFSFEDQKKVEPKLRSGTVLYKGKRVWVPEKDGSMRLVKASYGIMGLLRLRHIAALKHHYLSSPIRSILIPKGRMRGGTARMGEGELLTTLMQNMPSDVRDSLITSDMTATVVCSVCRKLTINCDCSHPKPPPTAIMVRYGLVLLDMYVTLATLNTPDKGVYCIAYFTRT